MNITTTKGELYSLALIEKPSASTIYLNISADCFLDNSAKRAALFLLYSDILHSGTRTLTRDEFKRKCDELGTKISISTTNGVISIELAALSEKISPSLQLLNELIDKPAFKGSELVRAKRTLKNNLELSREDAKSIAHQLLKNTCYDKKSRYFGYLPEDVKSEVDNISITDLKSLHNELQNAYWVITVGGNKISLSKTQTVISKLKNKSIVKTIVNTEQKHFKQTLVQQHEVKSKQNIEISIGAPLPFLLSDSDLPAFMFGLAVLGKWGGFAGRLMSTVREKEGLTYGIYAKTEGVTNTEPGHWRIMSFFAPKDVIRGITSTLREINIIAEKGITNSELLRFKTILKTSETLVFDSLSGTTKLVHQNLLAGFTWKEYYDFRSTFQTLTKKQINQALKKYLRSDSLCISAVGPIESVWKDLQKFAN